jgi:MATE family multidrug resistance protein
MPALGLTGAGIATGLTRVLTLIALVWLVRRLELLPRRWGPFDRVAWQPAGLRELLAVGLPIAVQTSLEMWAFNASTLIVGHLDATSLAAHAIALNLASITFMVPLGISSAAAVVVGHAVGRVDAESAWESAQAALLVAIAFMGATGIAFLLLPGPLARAYTGAPEVLAVAMALIPLAGVFQVFDGIQVTSIGILRGLGDTRTPMMIGILGFWLLGLPVSLVLAYPLGFGARGLWWGLVLGLVIVAAFLLSRVRWKLRQPLRRVQIEHDSEFRVPGAGPPSRMAPPENSELRTRNSELGTRNS